MKIRKQFVFIGMIILLTLISCFSDWKGEGTITINLGGGNSRNALPWPPVSANGNILEQLSYTITLTGISGKETIYAKGTDVSISHSVTVGHWNVNVDAYFNGNLLYATGNNNVDVKAGQANYVPIKMEQINGSVTSVFINPPTASVQRGSSLPFTANVMGQNPAQTVTWRIEPQGVQGISINPVAGDIINRATLTVTANAPPTIQQITIIATSVVDNTKSGTAIVTITDAGQSFAITQGTITPAGTGTISFPSTAMPNETVTVTATPSTGYVLERITSSLSTLTISVTGNTSTFVMPAQNITINAVFTQSAPGLTLLSDFTAAGPRAATFVNPMGGYMFVIQGDGQVYSGYGTWEPVVNLPRLLPNEGDNLRFTVGREYILEIGFTSSRNIVGNMHVVIVDGVMEWPTTEGLPPPSGGSQFWHPLSDHTSVNVSTTGQTFTIPILAAYTASGTDPTNNMLSISFPDLPDGDPPVLTFTTFKLYVRD